MGMVPLYQNESYFLQFGNYVSKSENNFFQCTLLPKILALVQYGFHVSDMAMFSYANSET